MAETNTAAALQNVYRTPELWQKIVFTFLCLLVYRTGAHITAPGIDVQALTDYFQSQTGGGGLLGLYAVQHSVMARPVFNSWFTRFIPVAAELSTYTLASSVELIQLYWFWQTMCGVVWQDENPV